VALNCAAMPESLLESELFGHVKGAFTDAKQSHDGLLVQADKGTLFLDEIGDMPLGLQPKLLRALEDRKVRPVGGQGEVAFEARIVAATNHDLEDAVAQQRFRSDLYFRLNVIQIELPPLRARGSDVLLLAQHFLNQFAREAKKPVMGLTSGAAEKLLAYSWPGNVRELRNLVERLTILNAGRTIAAADLPADMVARKAPSDGHAERTISDQLESAERALLTSALRDAEGHKGRAADLLGISRHALKRRLQRLGLD
jgi:two-component system response regulator HydG